MNKEREREWAREEKRNLYFIWFQLLQIVPVCSVHIANCKQLISFARIIFFMAVHNSITSMAYFHCVHSVLALHINAVFICDAALSLLIILVVVVFSFTIRKNYLIFIFILMSISNLQWKCTFIMDGCALVRKISCSSIYMPHILRMTMMATTTTTTNSNEYNFSNRFTFFHWFLFYFRSTIHGMNINFVCACRYIWNWHTGH